jgi:hypothetical protein
MKTSRTARPPGQVRPCAPAPRYGGPIDEPERDVPVPPASLKSWREVREWSADLLLSRTGEDVASWNRRVAEAGLDDEQALRAWLAERGVTGYAQALLVWERFGYPGFLTADADELISGQYTDRPYLRPVLDALLTAAPALGPVTVQARKTCVSLVSPRRTFAVVQPTTKSRVDVALHGHGQDRPALQMPGRGGWLAVEPVPGDSKSARWEVPVTVRRGDAGLDFSGPFVRGDRTDRHLALAWGDVPGDGTLRLFRLAKLRFADVAPGLVEEAMCPGNRLVARVRLTDARGNPGGDVAWSAERAR